MTLRNKTAIIIVIISLLLIIKTSKLRPGNKGRGTPDPSCLLIIRSEKKINPLGPYALIVLDFRMPKMNGIKFLTRAMQVALDTVRVILTGNASLRSLKSIPEGWRVKHISIKELTGKILLKDNTFVTRTNLISL